MSINLGVIGTTACVNVPPVDPPDDPGISRLVVKPGAVLACELGAVKFGAFLIENGVETDVTGQSVFVSSNSAVMVVSPSGGNATGVAPGVATITATYGALSDSTQATVLAGENCCEDRTVAMMMLVDQTKSMSQCYIGSGSGCSTKLAYARNAAIDFINGVNETKDLIGLERFTLDQVIVMSPPISDKAAVAALITPTTILQTQQKTTFYLAIAAAIDALASVSADTKVLVLISDGEDTSTSYTTQNPFTLIETFKQSGGIVMCLGVRAHGPGYDLLSQFASGGFFINAYPTSPQDSLSYFTALRSYICGGNCIPEGDEWENRGTLNYNSLLQWDLADQALFDPAVIDPVAPAVMDGYVDLLGNGFFDFIPGNGLYVDLVSGSAPSGPVNPLLITKSKFAIVSGDEYRLALRIARDEIQVGTGQPSVRVQVIGVTSGTLYINTSIGIPENTYGFRNYGLSFVASASEDVKITIWQNVLVAATQSSTGQSGILLNEVEFTHTTSGSRLFYENFDDENPVYIGPKCGQGTTYVDVGVETVGFVWTYVAQTLDYEGHYTKIGDKWWNDNGRWYLKDVDTGLGYSLMYLYGPGSGDPDTYPEFPGGGMPAEQVDGTFPDGAWAPVGSTITEYEYSYNYGTTYGYNCYTYGEGCLDTPPPSQLSDPNPLINLELGIPPGSFTATMEGCASCSGQTVIGGEVLDSNQDFIQGGLGGVWVTEADVVVTLANATAITRWRMDFHMITSVNGFFGADLALDGSNDNLNWTNLDNALGITMFAQGYLILTSFSYLKNTAAYKYYRGRVTYTGNAPIQPGVNPIAQLPQHNMQLTIYQNSSVSTSTGPQVCKTATATGETEAAAKAAAKSAATQAAQAALLCQQSFTATETYTSDITGKTATATATSLNSITEAIALAKAAAKAIADTP